VERSTLIVAGAVVALLAGGCGSSAPAESPSASSAASASPAADSGSDAGWFTVAAHFPNEADFEVFPNPPKTIACGSACGISHQGSVIHYGPGKDPGAPVIQVSGPDSTAQAGTLAAAGTKVSTTQCSLPSQGTPLKVGGADALKYSCAPAKSGNTLALVVWRHDEFTFTATYSASPARFQKYVPSFEAIYGSFAFKGTCTVANSC
jgi:hypothetical protein